MGEKSTRGRKNNVTASRVIEKLKYNISMQYKLTPMNSGCVACCCQLIPLSGSAQRETIVPANNTSTTQFVFGQERSLFPHPKIRNIN